MPTAASARRLRRRLVPTCLAALAVLVLARPAEAADLRTGDRIEVTGPIDDDVYAAGQDVRVAGAVVGDVFAAARTVGVSGTAGGSLNALAQAVEVSGQVAGSIRAAGQAVELDGEVGGDAVVAAQKVVLGPQGVVGRDLVVQAGELDLQGRVAGRLTGNVGELSISGTVAGVQVTAERVTLAEGARIDGDLVYTSATRADIADGAVVTGRVVQRRPPAEPASSGNAIRILLSAVGAALLGLAALWLLPPFLPAASRVLRKSPGAALGWALAGLVLVPMALLAVLVAVAFTGVGGLLVLALGLGYAGLLVFAKVVVGFTLGSLVLRLPELEPKADFGRAFLAVVAGVGILSIVSAIPVVGGIIVGAAGLAGFGAALSAYLRWRRTASSPGFTG
jgi:cytoskeletal protein CcmA (bactofilin family)